MTDHPFPSRFLDGTTPSPRYLEQVRLLIGEACDAEEAHGVDECERAAERRRNGQACIMAYGQGFEVVVGNWSIYQDTSAMAMARCVQIRDLPGPILERLARARRRMSGIHPGYPDSLKRYQYDRVRRRLNDWALAETRRR